MRMLKVPFMAVVVIGTLFFAHTTHAQYSTQDAPISFILTPSYPRPYQQVTVSPRSSLIDLSASAVTISANGVVIQKGTGTQSASVTVGGSGEVTKITVSVLGPDGRTYSTTNSVRPADVALVVEPDTTTHPLYKGLPLVASEGLVRLVAIPDLRTTAKVAMDPSTLVYQWKLGSQVLTSASGIGRSVLVATAPVRYRDAVITLTVTSPDSAVVAEAQTTITPTDPIARIYSYDPLLGPDYDHALTSVFSLSGTEASFRVVPYFFSAPPTIEWSVGGKAQGAQQDITVRSTGSGAGSATLEARAKNTANLQTASSRTTLRFGEGSSPFSIFGF